MSVFRKVFDRVLRVFGALFLLLLLFAGSLVFFSRQERALAKEFLLVLGQKDFFNAYAFLAEETKLKVTLAALEARFENMQIYTKSTFRSVRLDGEFTTISGTAVTDSNCSSSVTFKFRREKILSFQISPACLRPDQTT